METRKDRIFTAFKPCEIVVVYEVGLFKVTFKSYGDDQLSTDRLNEAKLIIADMDQAPIAQIKRKVRHETGVDCNITLNRFIFEA